MNLTIERVTEEAVVLETSLFNSLSFAGRWLLTGNDRDKILQALVDATLSFRPKRRSSKAIAEYVGTGPDDRPYSGN